MKYQTEYKNSQKELHIQSRKDLLTINEEELGFNIREDGYGRYLIRVEQRTYRVYDVEIDGENVSFTYDGVPVSVNVRDEQALLLEHLGMQQADATREEILKAPMPGRILEMQVSEEQEVRKGQPVAILEAMKMENQIKAPVDGRVVKIFIKHNQNVEKNDALMEIEASG